MNLIRVIFIALVAICLIAGACTSQGSAYKTKISHKYHKKEHTKHQANINSLHYASKANKSKKNKPGFFKRIFPGKKSYTAAQ